VTQAIWTVLDPVIEHLKTLDLAHPEAVRRSLTEKFGELPQLEHLCRQDVDNLCPREVGTARFGRLSADRNGFSVDTVLSSGKGIKHTHPAGEVNWCFAFSGEPTFDGHPPGWVVYAPKTTHPANVQGGSMFMVYFLPGGQIEWHRD
jgi:hypothetical protein